MMKKAISKVTWCWRAWAGERYAKTGAPRFWLLLTVVMLVLGVNKQLDFQTLLIGMGRSAARGEGSEGQWAQASSG